MLAKLIAILIVAGSCVVAGSNGGPVRGGDDDPNGRRRGEPEHRDRDRDHGRDWERGRWPPGWGWDWRWMRDGWGRGRDWTGEEDSWWMPPGWRRRGDDGDWGNWNPPRDDRKGSRPPMQPQPDRPAIPPPFQILPSGRGRERSDTETDYRPSASSYTSIASSIYKPTASPTLYPSVTSTPYYTSKPAANYTSSAQYVTTVTKPETTEYEHVTVSGYDKRRLRAANQSSGSGHVNGPSGLLISLIVGTLAVLMMAL